MFTPVSRLSPLIADNLRDLTDTLIAGEEDMRREGSSDALKDLEEEHFYQILLDVVFGEQFTMDSESESQALSALAQLSSSKLALFET